MSALNTLKAPGSICVLVGLILLTLPGNLVKGQRREATTLPRPTTSEPNVEIRSTKSLPQLQTTRRRRALLVGISKYEKVIKNGSPWVNLVSNNDLELLADVLVRRFQFKPEDIKIISDDPIDFNGKTLTPSKPTHDLIIETIRSFLIMQTQPGDVVFFHFSGHGCQIQDDGTDELDGFDETLVPIDYVSKEDGSKDIRDDEIGDLLAELSKKNPSNVTITIDSCFSSTATRGDYDLSRGGNCRSTREPKQAARGEDGFSDFMSTGKNRVRQPQQNYVFLSAASSRQSARQELFNGKWYGVFTYSLAKAMEAAAPTSTYRDIYEKVWNEVTNGREQQPQIEGDQLDNIFLQEGALPPESYIPVEIHQQKVNQYLILLMAGTLQGMTVGSKFALYPPATKSPGEAQPIAEARVIKVRATNSTLEMEGNAKPELLKTATRAFEVSRNYESVLKVAMKDASRFAGLEETLKTLGLAMTVPESSPAWNVLIRAAVQADRDERIVPPDFRGAVLQRRDGRSILARIDEGEGMSEKIKEALISGRDAIDSN
jgi:Caspase domain